MTILHIEFEPSIEGSVRQSIMDGVDDYNIAVTRLPDYFPVNLVIRDEHGEVAGGLLGQLWGGWLQVNYLWVADAVRSKGHGTRLIKGAEEYARVHGATAATVETHSFQARPFYERLGYKVFGTLEGYPSGYAKFFLRKELV